ncbi:M48 family metallopeptidase [Fibrobacter sp. UWB11]|uniref:M48 family metallopeptidase n=1 Tax=Fibrobacter sp. UWB11 TaxID=1896202 RepID=UPI0009258A7B|nr:SprT family zinc-dependent metalloprotease [Fibrobacter sp. UWB11]SIN90018.1 hypothetical protein SAMN05720758_0481 [Fibrobacter sp. UWB11]
MNWKGQQVAVVRSKRKKTASIMIERDGSISVLVPENMNENLIIEILDSKEYSIIKNQTLWHIANDGKETHPFVNGQTFMFKGQNYALIYKDKASAEVEFVDDSFLMNSSVKDPHAAFEKFYKSECRKFLTERFEVYKNKIPVQPQKIGVRQMSTRWGSCTPSGNVNINWNCVMAPQFVFDYILVHELVHLKYHRHNNDFWQTVGFIIPDFEMAKDWLLRNGVKMVI